MFHILPGNFFVPLSSPNRIIYWECICKLFSTMEHQLSFGVERDVLVDELEYYFDQTQAAEMEEDEFQALDSRGKANSMLRKLEFYGWIEVETDKSYVQRVNFKEYAVKIMKTLLEIAEGKQIEYQGYIYTIYSLVRSNTDHPGIVLLQILENTDMLITGLKNLNSNKKNSVLIYLGGYHNAVRRQLLQKLYSAFPQAEYLHFGDIDIGGFEIYQDLRRRTGIPFRPYLMGIEQLQQYGGYAKKLTENDRKRLDELLKKEEYREVWPVLQYMKENGGKLEQECIVVCDD